MRALFVGDNRSSLNWGRAASIALHELLSRSFEIAGSIPGSLFSLQTADFGYVNTLMPQRHYRFFRKLLTKRHSGIVRAYLALEHLAGAQDVIDEDPLKSVRNFHRYSSHYPVLQQILDSAKSADVIVVDGDGDLHFTDTPRRQTSFLLAMMHLGQSFAKPVFLVNAMMAPPTGSGKSESTFRVARQFISRCKALTVRDPLSYQFAQRELATPIIKMIPDSLFAWYEQMPDFQVQGLKNGDCILPYPEEQISRKQLDFNRPYLCIGGGAVSAAEPDRATEAYIKLVEAIQQIGLEVILVESDAPDQYLRKVAANFDICIIPATTSVRMAAGILANARAFVTGRYHPAIMASLGGTPCILLDSHGHKMQSLAATLAYKSTQTFSAMPDEDEISRIALELRKVLEQGETLRREILARVSDRSKEAGQLPLFLKQQLEQESVGTLSADSRQE
jgi:polysaccharide pyruvyl transferase WcaK-like protein